MFDSHVVSFRRSEFCRVHGFSDRFDSVNHLANKTGICGKLSSTFYEAKLTSLHCSL